MAYIFIQLLPYHKIKPSLNIQLLHPALLPKLSPSLLLYSHPIDQASKHTTDIIDMFYSDFSTPSIVWVPCIPDYATGTFTPVYNLSNIPENTPERLSNLPRGGIKSKPWKHEEDEKLRELVQKHGVKKWALIALELNGLFESDRKGKNCRERWNNHLNPEINKGEWSYEEDLVLLEKFKSLGSRWSVISKEFKGRTENSIKNRWNTLMKSCKSIISNSNTDIATDYLIKHISELVLKQ